MEGAVQAVFKARRHLLDQNLILFPTLTAGECGERGALGSAERPSLCSSQTWLGGGAPERPNPSGLCKVGQRTTHELWAPGRGGRPALAWLPGTLCAAATPAGSGVPVRGETAAGTQECLGGHSVGCCSAVILGAQLTTLQSKDLGQQLWLLSLRSAEPQFVQVLGGHVHKGKFLFLHYLGDSCLRTKAILS